MTDKDIFERTMSWLGMRTLNTVVFGKETIVIYDDVDECDPRFSKVGYDQFKAGAIFDSQGNIVSAYVDSHAAYASSNATYIYNKFLALGGIVTPEDK